MCGDGGATGVFRELCSGVILKVFSLQRRVSFWGVSVAARDGRVRPPSLAHAINHMLFIWPCDCLKFQRDFYVSKEEEGVEGRSVISVLKRCAQIGIGLGE